MKTQYRNSNLKDTIATASVLAATMIGILGTMMTSPEAHADYVAVQQLETIVVTAPRMETVTLDTIVVTASREATSN